MMSSGKGICSPMMWVGLVLLLTCQWNYGLDISDCISPKYYHFDKDHTACLPASVNVTESGVSDEDKEFIVDQHNHHRKYQYATNMQKMVWDDELAELAQKWADNCEFNRDAVRAIPGKFSNVGQNIARRKESWERVLKDWVDESHHFNYGNGKSNKYHKANNWLQMIWAATSRIGCGYTNCSATEQQNFYVCNYAPGLLPTSYYKPFKGGSKCDDCPGKCKDNLCDCGGKVCFNGGSLELSGCQCCCVRNWFNPEKDCALDCDLVIEPARCQTYFASHCTAAAYIADICPNSCSVCPHANN